MTPISLHNLAEILDTAVAEDSAGLWVDCVSTDSRSLPDGCVFFALSGERFNGDDFAAAALAGAANVVVVRKWKGGEVPAGKAVLRVPDPLLAMQKLACWWRQQLEIPVIAITGSNGKTSTKDFLAAILAKKFEVAATVGNLNNHIGVPLSVLAAPASTGVAVWEIGMNHAGEILPLCEIVQPKIGIIASIGTAHIEHLGSRAAIAEEKGMLARVLPEDGLLIVPAGCEFSDYFRDRTRAHFVPVGNGRGRVRSENLVLGDDFTEFDIVIDGEDRARARIGVPGRHMVTNALLAATAARHLGVPLSEIVEGLGEARLTYGRLRRYVSRGIAIIDDTYNANPESMTAALDTLAEVKVAGESQRIAVLGRMGELGIHGAEAHLGVGRHAAQSGLRVIAVGAGAERIAEGAVAAGGEATHLSRHREAADFLVESTSAGDVILFKGSRTATIEEVMQAAFPIES